MKKLLLMQLLPVLCLVSGSIQVVSSFAPSSEAGSRRRHHQRRVSSTQRRNSLDHHHRHHHNRVVEDEEETNDSHDLDAAAFCHPRRKFLRQVMIGSTAAASSLLLGSSTGTTFPAAVPPALARGLASFPCEAPLLNVYHLMRAGTSLLEEEDIWSTNPLFLTNREAALSSTGVEEAQAASRVLQEADIQPSVIKYSLAASSVDTASVIRDELKVGQNRLIPEFTFMDPRALGKYDMMSLSETFPAIVAMDDLEAGYDGKGEGARPPPNTDGTPQDTLADQAIRLRQLMSVLETQFSGDNIVLVFPDGSSPALLSAMMAGIPYNKAHVLEFAPGEIRLDVTMAPTVQLYETKVKDNAKSYNALIAQGTVELDRLRSMKEEDIVSKKDLLMEEERIALDEEYRQRDDARMANEESIKQARLERQQEMERTRLERRGILQVDNERRASRDTTRNMDKTTIPTLVIGGGLATYAVVTKNDLRKSDDTTSISPMGPSDDKVLSTVPSAPFAYSGPAAATEGDDLFAGMLNDYQQTPTSTGQGGAPSLYDTPKKSPEERKDDARQAMQAYIDQDDGGEAWLQVMSAVIDEDDEDDLFISDSFNNVDGSTD